MMWHRTLDDVPAGPSIIVANEFVDALPIHQAVKKADGWHERVVEIAPTASLPSACAREPLPHFDATTAARAAPVARRLDLRMARPTASRSNSAAASRTGGAALIIDYGHAQTGLAKRCRRSPATPSPIRCARRARPTSPRMSISSALAQGAESIGARVHGPVPQRDFLRRLGIEQRAAALKARVPARQGVRDRERACAPDRPAAERHGRIVQGHRHRRAGARCAAGLRE